MLNKWQSIDDEIWAKIIVLERNRRVAKAYARAPVLTVNGSDDGFDGFRIGLAGFDNPLRDSKTEEVKRHIGQVSDCSGNVNLCIRLFDTLHEHSMRTCRILLQKAFNISFFKKWIVNKSNPDIKFYNLLHKQC